MGFRGEAKRRTARYLSVSGGIQVPSPEGTCFCWGDEDVPRMSDLDRR